MSPDKLGAVLVILGILMFFYGYFKPDWNITRWFYRLMARIWHTTPADFAIISMKKYSYYRASLTYGALFILVGGVLSLISVANN